MKTITIIRPNDFHVHLRERQLLQVVLSFTSGVFGRAVAMGNLSTPITTAKQVMSYRSEILAYAYDLNQLFNPIMSVMLVNSMTPRKLERAYKVGAQVLKLIPGGTSTNSKEGVSLVKLSEYYPVLAKAQELGMIFSVHFELVVDPESGDDIPELARERRAIPYLEAIIKEFPDLKIVVEHVTTKEMVELVKSSPENVTATITAHHLLLTASDVIDKYGTVIDPFNYCKPVAKTAEDREAIIKAVISGNQKFFFGSDSAPHSMEAKMKTPPAAGIFSAPVVLPILAQVFEKRKALDKLESFISRFGAEFYGLPLNSDTITLKKEDWIAPKSVGGIPIFLGGEILHWQVA